MSEAKQGNPALGYAISAWFGVIVLSLLLAGVWGALHDASARIESLSATVSKLQKPAPTPAPCCKADDCRKELAQVDARFGDVWDELVEVQEQLAKVKPCGCGPVKECCCEPSKPCACSDKPACECKPAANSQLPTKRVLKRCK